MEDLLTIDLVGILEEYLHPNFPKWMICSRVTEIIFSLVIVGLDAFAISQMNKNPFLGPPALTGLNMFTVSSNLTANCKSDMVFGASQGPLFFRDVEDSRPISSARRCVLRSKKYVVDRVGSLLTGTPDPHCGPLCSHSTLRDQNLLSCSCSSNR